MKRINKLLSLFTLLVLVLSMMAVPASAETAIHGTSTITFSKYLIMDANANVPNASFSFTIESGTAVPAVTEGDNKTPAVMAGPYGAKLSYGTTNETTVSVTFTPEDTANSTLQTGDTLTLVKGEKYAKKVVNVDLTGVTFSQPGIYRYIIKETTDTSPADGVTYDTVTTRYLDIYVESNGDNDEGALEIGGSILHNNAVIMGAAGGEYDEKDTGFQNKYATYDLTFSKDITGNQGFRSKFFTFTVAISGAAAGTKYTVNIANASANDGAQKTNPTELVADDSGSVTGTFYLKDNQSITIYGLTAATKYTISENEEDYTPSYKLDDGEAVDGNSTPDDEAMGNQDHTAAFTNYRNGVVPTGIMLDVAPYALVVLIAFVGAVLIISKKVSQHRKDNR